MLLGLVLGFAVCFVSIHGHGYLIDPPARSSAWTVDQSFRQCCTYSNHMEMFCGGIQYQWNVHKGKCSICGEPYDRQNKLFEKGGAMYLGKIVKTYNQGQQVDVKVVLTANHRGYFEFRLCNLDATPNSEATQECLDRRVLKIAGSDSTRFGDVGVYGSTTITARVQLPADVSCSHCVFQWKYTSANSWGTDPVTGQSGLGMGVENETFMGCADISIVSNGGTGISEAPVITPTETTQAAAQSSSTTTTTPRPATTTPYVPSGSTTWSSSGIKYKVGDVVLYNGVQYRCVFDHTSYQGAEPGIFTWAWWQKIN